MQCRRGGVVGNRSGDAQELAFESPLQEQELIVNDYRYLRCEKVERYPWEVIE